MSKPNATLAIVATLALGCLPSVAATISSDEIRLRLGGEAMEVGPNQFEVAAGSVALLGAQGSRGDLFLVFAVGEDAWGVADYSNILPLPGGYAGSDGMLMSFVEVPAELAGKRFYIQAIAISIKGDLKGSQMLTVTIPGAQILLPPPAPRANRMDPIQDVRE